MKLRVYGDMLSGNCYKVKLLLQWLGLEHEWRHVDVMAGETRTPEFARLNPNAKIPVLELADGTRLAESNAILNFLAEGTPFLPSDRLERARVLQWQFFEQYSHEPYIAVARFINKYLGLPAERLAEYQAKQAGGHKALAVMESHLQGRAFFVGGGPTIADLSLFAYTHVADEGGFDLAGYPAIRDWIARVQSLPGSIPMARENG
jgi:glutathione S-transferase